MSAQKTVCDHFEVELITEPYNHQEFLDYVKGLENEPERGKRCVKCIELRLKKAFQKAVELGISLITTSLVISPHKNFQMISEIGKNLELKTAENLPQYLPLKYLPLDFKKKDGFLKTNNISKELNIYRQKYCGCEFAPGGGK